MLGVLDGIADLYVAKGKKVLHFDMKSHPPSREETLGLIMGRSGKLRSPTIRTGRTLVVGYTPGLLEETLL